jgi:broad specificity phosphatase PhoE
MTRIVALRHAPTAWNRDRRLQGRTDVALDEEGVAVAARWRIAPEWAGYRILSSPLQRARMTAAILFPDAEIGIDRRLVEMDFGTWEGKRLAELRADPTEDAAAREAQGLYFKAPEAWLSWSGRPCW